MQTLSWNEFTANVQQWATERGIYEHSTPDAQALKTLSEIGELADSVIKGDHDGLKDAVGDVAVCLVNYAAMKGIDLSEDPGEVTKEDIPGRAGKANLTAVLAMHASQLVWPLVDQAEYETDLVVYVCLQAANEIAFLSDLEFLDCCAHAWETIKDRKGRMAAGGAFVKDEA